MDPITGCVQNYSWGSTTAIPALLGLPPDGQPQAELWFGAHPVAPSRVGGALLADRIEADPAGVLGEAPVQEFGPRMPYLLKVLAAAQPLSLQAHPTRAKAEAGFAREEAAGVDRAASHRLYRDDWPKPEMLVALDDVEALCGFAEPDETYAKFAELGVEAANELVGPLRGGGPDQLAEVFGRVLRLGEEEREVIAQVVTAAAELLESGEADGDAEQERFARTAVELDEFNPGDPGVLAGLLMNRVRYGRFVGLFLPAGNLHAYLRGTGVEVMANSDNVMRGGLTPKHVDVDELLSIVDFRPGRPQFVDAVAEAPSVWRYRTPAPEFALWRVDGAAGDVVLPAGDSGRIVLAVDGAVDISDGSSSHHVPRGQSVFGYPGETLRVSGPGTVMVAAPGL